MYYRKIEGNRDLLADDRGKPTVTAARFIFVKKLSHLWDLFIIFFLKILRFGGSIPPVRFGKAWCCLI